MDRVDITTSCYGYYGYFVDANGTIRSEHCMKLYPTWMGDLRSHLGKFRMRELFIPGSHDSASYKNGFDPLSQENLVTKYWLTQDDNIRGQLLQGVRYLDLRVGYYRTASPPFYANHGFVRLQPLKKILDQVRDYALETNEIIILDVQEFPVGFGKDYDIHDKLIRFLNNSLWDVMADPAISWYGKLEDIWARNRTVILCYDHEYAMRSYADVVWRSVEQKWGDVQRMEDLKSYLFKVHQRHVYGITNRPVADMAELTPDPWGVITDRYGGLRKMADSVNRHVTKWYFEELGPTANVVAVDFVRGTSIIEAALYWNLKREPSGADLFKSNIRFYEDLENNPHFRNFSVIGELMVQGESGTMAPGVGAYWRGDWVDLMEEVYFDYDRMQPFYVVLDYASFEDPECYSVQWRSPFVETFQFMHITLVEAGLFDLWKRQHKDEQRSMYIGRRPRLGWC
ncbi:hypothetical protein pipiens_000914, partial [Culex pipiens pipiens]